MLRSSWFDIFLLCLSLAHLSAAQQQNAPVDFMPICDPDNFEPAGLPVPDLPDQFSFTIEGNLLEHNSTSVMTEYYDGPGNRGRLEFGFNGSSGIAIFDYDEGEIFVMPDFSTGGDCRVYPIAESRFINFTFGIENRNGSIHIGSPRTFVEQLRDDSVTRYIGEDKVRGIPTQRWQACYGAENISYLIDYYFVAEAWSYEEQDRNLEMTEMVPVLITLNATRIINGTIRNIYHIYTVVDFKAGPDSVPDAVFQIPNGLACAGRFPGRPIPSLPEFFSTSVQEVSSVDVPPTIRTLREFYDLPNKLLRYDGYDDGAQSGVAGPTRVIHDFGTSVQYSINTRIHTCSIYDLSLIAPYFPDASFNDDGSFQLISPEGLFFLGNEFNYSYEGVSNVRGVDVDSWVSVRDFERVAGAINLTDAVYEVFFTRPGWIYSTDRSISSDPVPWRIKFTTGMLSILITDNVTTYNIDEFQRDFFDFSTEEPPYDVFDISSCSKPDDFYTVALIIPGQEKGLDFGQLRRNIRMSVSNYTGLRPLQIGNIQIVSENGTDIFVTLQISNLTSLAKIDPSTNVTAQQAVDLITMNTIGSQLPFQIQISPNVSVTPSLRVAGRGPRPTCNDDSCDCTVPLVNPNGTCSTPDCATPPDIPQFFSVHAQQIDQAMQPPIVQNVREFYDYSHNLFRYDFYYDGSSGGSPGPITFIHDFSTALQYIVGYQVRFCYAQPLQELAPYFWDVTVGDDNMLQLVSPNNLFFRGDQYNYTYQGATNVRGVDVDSWVSYREFESITNTFNFSNIYYQVFYTRPGWTFPSVHSVTTQPVPWRLVINGTVSRRNMTDNSTITYNTTYEMDIFEFSTDEPSYDVFDVSSCYGPDDYYTLVLFIPGKEIGINFGQLRRNIRTSISNYTGLRPLQIGNIQLVRENGTHIVVTLQISNLTYLARIDPSTNVTAQQAVDLITMNTIDSQLPFQIEIYPNVSVTPSLHVAGRRPRQTCSDDSYDCTVPLVNPNGTCSTPDCATPPDIPQFFSVHAQQIDQAMRPPIVQNIREFYDYTHNVFRFDVYYDGSLGGSPGPITIIHDFGTSIQYVVSQQVRFCYAQSLQELAPYLWDVTVGDDNMLQLVSPNNLFFRGDQYNYTYQGATNVRGVDVDSWVSYREFESITNTFNFSNIYYQVFYTRPGWTFPSVHSVTTQPVPWRLVINGTVSRRNMTDNSTITYNTTYEMDIFEFSTDEPSYDVFDVSSCYGPDDYYTLVLFIPGNETGINFGQLRRNIRTSISNYTGLRPLQIGNIQFIRENGTHIVITLQISNLTYLAKIDPSTNVTAQQAVDLITMNTTDSQLPFQIEVYPNVSVTPSLHVAGRGPRPTCNDSSCDCTVPLVNPNGTCSTLDCATPPDIPQFFSVHAQQIDQAMRPPIVQNIREFYDYSHNLFRYDFYYDGSSGGSPGPITFIHDFSTALQYIVGYQVRFCYAQPLQELAPYFWDVTVGDGNMLQLVSPNNLFFRGDQYNYTYQGATNVRGVDVDSWVSYREFESITNTFNFSNIYYQVFYTRPGWTFPSVHSVTTQPVPWRLVINGTVSRLNMTDNSTITYNTTYEMDIFEFSTDEPSYDVFDVSSCYGPDDYYTLVLFIPGNETGINFGQLRRNIRMSISNYTGLRPLQIGNIQLIRENGTHIVVTLQISNLTSLAKIDPSTNVTAQQAVDLITMNTIDSQLPFQIEIYPNVSVTPSLHVAGRGPRPTCNDFSCDCTVPLVNPNGTCSTPDCATPPDVPTLFSTYAQQVDYSDTPLTVRNFREFYDGIHKLYRLDIYYDGSLGGDPGPNAVIHDLNTSVQYVIGKEDGSCLVQPLDIALTYFWDVTVSDDNTLQLVSPNSIFFRGDQYNYTYQGATNIRGVDVDSWVSYREFEQINNRFNLSDSYYQVFYTRPGWNFANVHSESTQPVPWRIVINGTVSTLNMTDNSTITYNTTYKMDLFEFLTEEPPFDAFDVSSCYGPDDYYTLILFIPGNKTVIDFGQLRRNIRTSVSNYTGLRPLQIGNIQLIRENGTHLMVSFHISNLTNLAKIDPSTNITAQQAVDLITNNTISSQVPFQIQISPDISVVASLHVAGRGRNFNMTQCNSTANNNSTSNGGNCRNTTNITTKLGLSNGAVAGIAIALFSVGVIVGIVIQLCLGMLIRCCRQKRVKLQFERPSFKYRKQDEDIALD